MLQGSAAELRIAARYTLLLLVAVFVIVATALGASTAAARPVFLFLDAQTTGCAGTGACFWVGGTGSWTDGSHWADASNGTNTGSVPTSADAVYFDAYSGVGTSTVDAGMDVGSLNATGYMGTIALGTVLLGDHGDFTLQGTFDAASGMVNVAGSWDSHLGTFMKGTSTVLLSGIGKTLRMNGTAGFYNLGVYNSAPCDGSYAEYTTASTLDVSNRLGVGLYETCGGSLTTAGYNITGGADFTAEGGKLIASSSALTFRSVWLSFGGSLSLTTGSLLDTGGWGQGPYGGSFYCGTSTVTFTGSSGAFYFSPFYNLTISGSFGSLNPIVVRNRLTVTGTLNTGTDAPTWFNSLTATSGNLNFGGATLTHFSAAASDPAALIAITSADTWTSDDYRFTYADTKATDSITFTISSLPPGQEFTVTRYGTYYRSGAVTADGLATWTMLGSEASAVEVTVGYVPPPPALLRVTTNPAVPAKIFVDDVPRDDFGLAWMKIAPGTHTVSFGGLNGFVTPPPVTVTLTSNETTTVQGDYGVEGYLRVITDPAVPSTIYVDGVPRDDWGMWTALPPGTHTVHFGAVAGYDPPSDQNATVVAGNTTTITGDFVANPDAEGPDPSTYGMLRVILTAPKAIQILVDGIPRNDWGLASVKLAPGTYMMSVGDAYGVLTGTYIPNPWPVTVSAGITATYGGPWFQVLGFLRVTTSPALPATIYVDGEPRDDWGMWQSMYPTGYTVSFGTIPGYVTPAPQVVYVTAGVLTTVTGIYVAAAPAAEAATPAFRQPVSAVVSARLVSTDGAATLAVVPPQVASSKDET